MGALIRSSHERLDEGQAAMPAKRKIPPKASPKRSKRVTGEKLRKIAGKHRKPARKVRQPV
jgi:hypothetical protein